MRRLLPLAFLAFSTSALACGVCVDDKVASCYDYSVVERAKARGHEVAFFAIDGPLVRSAENRAALVKAIQGQRGVLPGTARVSLESAALSFAFDPARTSRVTVAGAVEKRLPGQALSLRFLRAMP